MLKMFLLTLVLGFCQSNPRLNIPEDNIVQRFAAPDRDRTFSKIPDPFGFVTEGLQGLKRNLGRSMSELFSFLRNGIQGLKSGFIPRPRRPPAKKPSSYRAPSSAQADHVTGLAGGNLAPQRPTSVYKESGSVQDNLIDSYGAPKDVPLDTYGVPHSVPSNSYVVPQNVPQNIDSYGAPQKAPLNSYTPPNSHVLHGVVQHVPQVSAAGAHGLGAVQGVPVPVQGGGGVPVTVPVHQVPVQPEDECAQLKALQEEIRAEHSQPTHDHHHADDEGKVKAEGHHPEKFISFDCEHIKEVVGQRLYYIDTKPLIENLKHKGEV